MSHLELVEQLQYVGHDILKKNAELLESQESPDIDNLMKIVEESITAYKTLHSSCGITCVMLASTTPSCISIAMAGLEI
jgi:hypothetical protein